MKALKRLLLPVAALVIGLASGYAIRAEAAETQTPTLKQMLDLMDATLKYISEYYVEPIDKAELVQSALKGMLSSLDPYSEFMTPQDKEQLDEETQGEYSGIGMQVGLRDGWPTVIAPFDGSPAQRMGLRPGDKIVEIEGVSTYDMSLNEVVKRLRGPQGTNVTIKVLKPGVNDPVEVTLTREKIKIHPVPYYDILEGNIGYIKMTSFSADAAGELSAIIDTLNSRGMKGLILDLRGNPGGLLREAVDVSDVFLSRNSLIVSTKGRGTEDVINYFAQRPERLALETPMVVLVDQGSASASEIVAGALQDWDRALIIGDTTFGKGLVQRVFPLSGDYAIRLTTSRYYTPSGRCINKVTRLGGKETKDTSNLVFYTRRFEREVRGSGGIVPDVVIEPEKTYSLTAKAASDGAVFAFAVDYTNKHKTPPASGRISLTSADMADFRKFLAGRKITFTECEWEEAEPQLKYWLEQDIAEKYWGMKGRYRQSLVGDPVVREAIERLRSSKKTDDLFLTAGSGK
ncbi:MAG: S41 family peptidase [candidate division WOR-3 bacterium]